LKKNELKIVWMKKRIVILGSTGSIGKQALEVIQKHPDNFEVETITANNNAELLVQQAYTFVPKTVVIVNKSKYSFVKEALDKLPINVLSGEESLSEVVNSSTTDIVLTAMVGYAGLLPTINAIKAGKAIALANKETLVVAGELITSLSREHKVKIYPVDSEHSAIFQCLIGELQNNVEKIYLTASGGPFRGKDLDYFKSITPKEALNHPNWCMGNKVTIDSASLMNKGLEAIEAKWLFNLHPDQIEVIVHPQSIVHSIVQFQDGSMKAQMGLPDMRLPILYAFSHPQRLKTDLKRFSFLNYPQLTFEKPNTEIFRNLPLAFSAMRQGGNLPCALNASNEVAVNAFLCERIEFLKMPDIIEKTINKIQFISNPTFEDYQQTDKFAREFSESLI
jgi:1-deoxy-D-xylulose-5-phosphate reductoisomerase